MSGSPITCNPDDFAAISAFVLRQAGIVLAPGKEYLVESRLAPLLKRHGLSSFGDLRSSFSNATSPIAKEVVEALTTNETFFFRDQTPFDALKAVTMPALIKKRADECSITIWCAACSTGQEPYSIAMLIKEEFPLLSLWNISIIATDLSEEVVTRASLGVFSHLEVNRGLPPLLLAKYFNRHGVKWEIDRSLRQMIKFQQLNLLANWPSIPKCDVVFIRNVLIYFSPTTKEDILRRIAATMRPHGHLFLGAAETTLALKTPFTRSQDTKAGYYTLTPESQDKTD